MTVSKSSWANGQPSIDIDTYDYSEAEFRHVLGLLAAHFNMAAENVVAGPDQFIADLREGAREINLLMDNYTFSIAFSRQADRDDAFTLLLNR